MNNADAANYTCVINSTCATSVTTNVAALTIGTSPTITLQPFSAVICLNQQASFNVKVTNATSYQWQFKPTGGSYSDLVDGGQVSGATSDYLIINNSTFANRGNYRCIIVGGTCSGGISSAVASLNFESPLIVSEPLSQSLCINQTATFSLVALGNNLTYQWVRNGADLTDDSRISGSTTSQLSISGLDYSDDATYYCKVQGLCPPPAYSDNVDLTVNFCTDVTSVSDVQTMNLYPNPNTGQFVFEANRLMPGTLKYEVLNTLGEIVSVQEYTTTGQENRAFNLMGQASGIYMLRITNNDKQYWQRIVVEK